VKEFLDRVFIGLIRVNPQGGFAIVDMCWELICSCL